MDKFFEYAPWLVVAFLFFKQNKMFITPENLTNTLADFNEKLEENRKSAKNVFDIEHKENNLQKKNKPNEKKEVALRRKLHELEKAPAPVLNIKGIKSRIECWGGNNDNKKTKTKSTVQREMPKSKDEKNEEMAANFLFEQKMRDDEEASRNNQNNNQGQGQGQG